MRPLGGQQVGALQLGLDQPLGPAAHVRSEKAEHPLDCRADLVFEQAVVAGALERREDGAAQERHEDEVVEVTRLQRGVLPVVGKREKLSRVSTEVGLGATHPAQDGSDDDGRRRASAFGAERGEAVDVAGGIAVMLAARGTELEAPGHEPGTPAAWLARAVRANRQEFRAAPPIGGLQPRLAGFGLLQPGIGVVLVAALEIELTIDRLRHQEAPATAGPVGIVVLVQRHVVDLALLEARGAIGVAQHDRVMLLPAVAAEVGRKEPVLGMIGIEDLPIEGEGATGQHRRWWHTVGLHPR